MNQLYWKEWRELRLLPIAALLAYLAISVAIILFEHDRHMTMKCIVLIPGLYVVCVGFWLYAGSAAFSSEISADTLQFLSVLPVSRHRFWLVKLAAVSCSAVSVAAITGASFYLLSILACPRGLFITERYMDPSDLIVSTFLLMIGCIAAGICASPFFSRAVNALVAAIVGGLLFQGLEQTIVHFISLHRTSEALSSAPGFSVALLWTLPLLFVSYQTFTQGETLKGSQKFRVGALSAAVSIALVSILFALGNVVKIW